MNFGGKKLYNLATYVLYVTLERNEKEGGGFVRIPWGILVKGGKGIVLCEI